jgi:hypothetical protein
VRKILSGLVLLEADSMNLNRDLLAFVGGTFFRYSDFEIFCRGFMTLIVPNNGAALKL